MTYFDDLQRSYADVSISETNEINTIEFLEAGEGVKDLFKVFNSAAFSPVVSDMTNNIKKIKTRYEELGPTDGKSLQNIVLSEAGQKKRDATQGLLWHSRGLRFVVNTFERNLDEPKEELSVSFNKTYSKTLGQYHNFLVRPVFKLAMNACPYRADFYAKLGSPLEKVLEQFRTWIKALGKIVTIIEEFFASGDYGKGL